MVHMSLSALEKIAGTNKDRYFARTLCDKDTMTPGLSFIAACDISDTSKEIIPNKYFNGDKVTCGECIKVLKGFGF